MKNTKILVGAAVLCLSWNALANLNTPTVFNFNAQNDANIIANVSSSLGLASSDVVDLLRLDSLATPTSGSPFSVTYGASGLANVSWNLTGTGKELYGIYIFGGSEANLYTVTTDERVSSGVNETLTISTPANNGGQIPAISHILFLGTKSTSVPDTGSTVALLGMALLSFRGLKEKFQKR